MQQSKDIVNLMFMYCRDPRTNRLTMASRVFCGGLAAFWLLTATGTAIAGKPEGAKRSSEAQTSAVLATAASTVETTVPITLKTKILGPNDVVQVRVYQEDDLETKAVINKEGQITLPLLGPVEVGQKTPDEATALIRGLYAKDYLVNPQVSVTVVEHAKLRFTVLGQVQRPGTYEFPVNEPLNLLQGIAMGGGYTRLGAPSKVSVQRLQNGKSVVFPLNAELMSKDKKMKPFEIMPDDIITVGERIF
jgi:protein involved in polysaccharide export with SLBB domain